MPHLAAALLSNTARCTSASSLALVAVAAIWVFLFRTYRGFQLQVGGLAPAAARYAGFSSRSASLWTALLISGGLAGLAGAHGSGRAAGAAHAAHFHRATASRPSSCASSGGCTRWASCSPSVLLIMMLIGGELGAVAAGAAQRR